MDIQGIGAATGTAATGPEDRQLEKLRGVALEFEALLTHSLLKSMRTTVMESDLLNPQGDTKYYRQMYDEELARTTAGRGGLGIADAIYRQYSRKYEQERLAREELAAQRPDGAPVQGPPTALEAERAYRSQIEPAIDVGERAREALKRAVDVRDEAWRQESSARPVDAGGTEIASDGRKK